METIKTISPRVSVVNDNGAICARIERSSFFIEQISCGTVERAEEVARIAAWELAAYDWQKQAHAAVVQAGAAVCESCPFRNVSGCLSGDCPVFRLLECANKAPGTIKRTVKKLRTLKD